MLRERYHTWCMPLSSDAVVMIVAATIALAVLIWLAYRWTISRQADYATIVRENDTAFQRVASMLGLTFVSGQVMHHPVMGDIAAFGVAQGLYRGFYTTLRVTSDDTTEPPVVFRTEILINTRANTAFETKPGNPAIQRQAKRFVIEPSVIKFEPRVPCRARSMSYEFFTLTDSMTLRTSIDALCDFGETIVQVRDAS